MCERAVALVCILFLSTSALVTRSHVPSPRARVCTLRCVRVRVVLNIPDRGLFRLVHPGYGRILFCPRLPPCLPFVFLSSLPSTPLVPVLPSSVFLSLPAAVGFLLFPLGTAVAPCLSFLSTNLISTLDLCTHEPSLRGAGCIPEALSWFALPEVWLLVCFQKEKPQQLRVN